MASVSTQQVRNSARRKLRWKCTVADVQKVWLVCSMKIFHKVTYGWLCLLTTCVHRMYNISLVTCFPPGPAHRHICNLNNLLQKQFRLCCFRCRFRSGFKSQKNKGLQLKPFHFWHNIHPQKWAHHIVQHKVTASRNSADTKCWVHQKLQQDEGEKTVRLQTSFVKACLSVCGGAKRQFKKYPMISILNVSCNEYLRCLHTECKM